MPFFAECQKTFQIAFAEVYLFCLVDNVYTLNLLNDTFKHLLGQWWVTSVIMSRSFINVRENRKIDALDTIAQKKVNQWIDEYIKRET